jgi:lipoprotein NlpD
MACGIDKLLGRGARGGLAVLAAALVVALGGCASNKARAPVEDRVAAVPAAPVAASAAAPPAEGVVAAPAVEGVGKSGYYSVRPGDTLIRIALENGQNWRDLVKWNKLDNPNVIEVGQVLRVIAPNADPSAAATRPVATARVDARPIERPPAAVAAAASSAAPVTPSSAGSAPIASAASAATGAAAPAPVAAREGDDDVNWMWPAGGAVVAQFDEARSKGLAIAGKAGEPVVAAADGRVVYAGSGLRGYGNLLIVKHNNTYLTAYAHNQTLLVKEDQVVRRGQRIAEMGSTDAERVQLHFEIRRLGKPVDPAKLLPPR